MVKSVRRAVILTPLGFYVFFWGAPFGVTPTFGAEPSHLNRIIEWRRCPNCDLSGANLTGANLKNVYLNGSNFSGANLSGADLSGAWLEGVDLSGTDLSNANLQGALIKGANLGGAKLCKTTMPSGQIDNSGCR